MPSSLTSALLVAGLVLAVASFHWLAFAFALAGAAFQLGLFLTNGVG